MTYIRRSRRQIKEEVIFILAQEGNMGIMKLMYKTNTCWNLISALLEELIASGIVNSENLPPRDTRLFSLTPIGIKTYQHVREISALMG